MPKTHNTPTGSPTRNFDINANSPVVAYDGGTPMPEAGSQIIAFNTPAGSPTRNFNTNPNSAVRGS
jgi:hypothetical protein